MVDLRGDTMGHLFGAAISFGLLVALMVSYFKPRRF
jgi:hypothetical protein